MKLNNLQIVDRNNRPSVLSPVGLRVFFINDGVYADPTEISGVTVFTKPYIVDASSRLDASQLLRDDIEAEDIVMHFSNSATDTTDSAFDVSNYTPDASTAPGGIYRVKTGEYVCVLDGTRDLSGLYDFHGSSVIVHNAASTVGQYVDVWTVKMAFGSEFQTIFHNFKLRDDTFVSFTTPISLQTFNRCLTKKIVLGARESIKITTDINVRNKDVTEDVVNLFKESVILNPAIRIFKVNHSTPNLPARVDVSGYADTSSTISITSDNTILWSWDTTELQSLPSVLNGTHGPITGEYGVQLKYTILDQDFITDTFYVQIT